MHSKIEFIEAIWVAAGMVAVFGTCWLIVASMLGIWPFRRTNSQAAPDTAADLIRGWYGEEDPMDNWWWGEKIVD
jgi:hypothetical protein